jgi:EpsI family protein
MGGVLYAHLAYRSRARKLAFVAAAIVVPIIANWLRAYLIVLIGHLSGNKYAVDVDHLIYGWLFFGVVIFLLFWVGSFWREDAASAGGRSAVVPDGAMLALPTAQRAPLYAAALAAIVLAALWRPIATTIDDAQSRAPVNLEAVAGAGGWAPVADPVADWRPRFIGPDAQRHQSFAGHGARVGLYLAFYRRQSDGNELVTSENVLVTTRDPQWRQTSGGRAELPWTGGASVTARAAELRGRTTQLAVRELYWIDGRVTASDHLAKVLLAIAKLRGRGDDSAAIVFYTPVGSEAGAAARTLEAFARDMSPAIETALARTAGH